MPVAMISLPFYSRFDGNELLDLTHLPFQNQFAKHSVLEFGFHFRCFFLIEILDRDAEIKSEMNGEM